MEPETTWQRRYAIDSRRSDRRKETFARRRGRPAARGAKRSALRLKRSAEASHGMLIGCEGSVRRRPRTLNGRSSGCRQTRDNKIGRRRRCGGGGVDLEVDTPAQSSLVKAKQSRIPDAHSTARPAVVPRWRPGSRRDSSRVCQQKDSPKDSDFDGKPVPRARLPQQLHRRASVPFPTYGFSAINRAEVPRHAPAAVHRLKIHLTIVSEDYGAI